MYLLWRQYRPIKVEHVSTLCYRGTFRFVNHFKLYSVFVLRSNIKLNNSIKRCIYYIRGIYYHWWKIFYGREQNILEYCFHELSVSRRFPPILTFFSLMIFTLGFFSLSKQFSFSSRVRGIGLATVCHNCRSNNKAHYTLRKNLRGSVRCQPLQQGQTCRKHLCYNCA